MMLTMRMAAECSSLSDGKDVADGRELDVAKASSQLLLLPRKADVMADPRFRPDTAGRGCSGSDGWT
jgi:hypothetical protein